MYININKCRRKTKRKFWKKLRQYITYNRYQNYRQAKLIIIMNNIIRGIVKNRQLDSAQQIDKIVYKSKKGQKIYII